MRATNWDEAVEALAKHLCPVEPHGWEHMTASTRDYYRLFAKQALEGVDAHIVSLAHVRRRGLDLGGKMSASRQLPDGQYVHIFKECDSVILPQTIEDKRSIRALRCILTGLCQEWDRGEK